MIDQIKEFWNKQPCDSLFSNREPNTREYFSEIADRRYKQIPEIQSFANFSRWRGRRVLEVGCGIGTDAINFSRAHADITAIDISDASIEVAKRNFEVWGNRAKFFCVNIEDLVKTNFYWNNAHSYDLIYSFGVLHHTPNPEQAFKNIHLLCGENTELRIMLYSKYSLHTLWVLLKSKGRFWKFNKLLANNAETQYGCPIAYHYTFSQIRKLMKGYNIYEMKKGYLSWVSKFIPKPLRGSVARLLGGYIFIIAKARFEYFEYSE